jgi:hypothetical protein
MGSGTTLAVALKHQRRGLGFDIRSDQVHLARQRIQATLGLLPMNNILWQQPNGVSLSCPDHTLVITDLSDRANQSQHPDFWSMTAAAL